MEYLSDDVMTRRDGTIPRDEFTLAYTLVTPHTSSAVLLIVHGINDHKGRYALLQDDLAEAGYTSFALDLQGFGLSEGKRTDVARYQDYHDDIAAMLDLIHKECPNEAVFLLGHSLGGLISATFCIDHPGSVDALVLSSPAFEVRPLPFYLEMLATLFYFLMPTASVSYPALHSKRSHDPSIANAVAKDPLIVEKATPRFYQQFKKMKDYCQQYVDHIDLPTLIMQAGDDVTVCPEGARAVYERLENPKKKLIWYEGYYHEVFHEMARTKVVVDLIHWLDEISAEQRESPSQ
ncbi:Lysophospholipase; Monoglyceride lipase; putative [hydrothermal vent metagenome]|uniref:Lysophospholipase Monoglyceride lipase putative n=1 Tax=hydrothermal vent metagenome TaxID=652676 RepID=A0A3B1CXB0_9ZZZZ